MYPKQHCNKLIVSLCFTLLSFTSVHAQQPYSQVVADAKLIEVSDTIVLKKGEASQKITSDTEYNSEEEKSAILLAKLGCLPQKEINQSQQNTPLADCVALKPLTIDHPTVSGSLTSLMNQLLDDNVFEGYNIKAKEVTTTSESGKNITLYGHSSLVHAKQLISLLTVNNIDFSWQLIPKSSAFNIRENWQDTKTEEKTSSIRTAQEYDLRLNFANQAEQKAFMPLINQFAKKDNEDHTGLLIDAWWQPFYRTFHPQDSFIAVKRISLQADGFVASTLVLIPNVNNVLKQINNTLSKTNINVSLSSEDVWVNPAFYRYLNGDFK
jgi:hypothetical protein